MPAIAEHVPGFSGDLWVALYAPRGTPPAVVDRLYGAVKAALASPDLQQRFETLGVTVMQYGPAELGRRQAAEFQRWKQIVKASGATAE